MGVVFTCLIIFAAFIAAAFGGLALHKRRPPEHKSDIARTVVGQVSGLVSLHLGHPDRRQFRVLLDPEDRARDLFRANPAARTGPRAVRSGDQALAGQAQGRGFVEGNETFWGGGAVDPSALTVAGPLANAKAVDDFLANLHPNGHAESGSGDCEHLCRHGRAIAIDDVVAGGEQAGVRHAHCVLAFWTAALFFGIALFAEPNALVHSALTFGAASIAFAIFLIFQLRMPYTGLYKVSLAPLEQAIEFIDR